MIEITPEETKIIKDILTCHVPDAKVWAFGSRVTCGARTCSDLDILVKAADRLDFVLLAEIKEAFMESDLPFRIDIVDWHLASESFKTAIADNCVEL
ncbi:MAG: nucleotidyltransferase domain-containing protein [Pseudomonadota bacterium]|nr:nucleotidyltransferase domain-containing protein [Pseudomonadota bacterium]